MHNVHLASYGLGARADGQYQSSNSLLDLVQYQSPYGTVCIIKGLAKPN